MNHVLIAHNLRSCYNVGSLLRTCDGLNVDMIMTGTTPYPIDVTTTDQRLPHVAARADKQISKTALGAQDSVNWKYTDTATQAIKLLRESGYQIAALEQTPYATSLTRQTDDNWGLIVGNEVNGIDEAVLTLADQVWQIPMYGDKKSLNVTIAAAIGLWNLNQK